MFWCLIVDILGVGILMKGDLKWFVYVGKKVFVWFLDIGSEKWIVWVMLCRNLNLFNFMFEWDYMVCFWLWGIDLGVGM